MTIWKYAIDRVDVRWLEMPIGARIIHVGMQNEQITLWAIVDPKADCEKRAIRVVGTGNPFPDASECTHLGTVFDGPFVWHVFVNGPLNERDVQGER